jgi:hypothetical protein
MKNIKSKKELSPEQRESLGALKTRFEKNMNRHKGLEWAEVQVRTRSTTALAERAAERPLLPGCACAARRENAKKFYRTCNK